MIQNCLHDRGLEAIACCHLSEDSRAVFEAWQQRDGDQIALTLQATPSDSNFRSTTITYPARIDEIVKRWNMDLRGGEVLNLYVAFREFALGIETSAQTLQNKICAVVERTLSQGPQAVSLQQIEELFAQGSVSREKARDQVGVVLIGSSGAGKSTFVNHIAGCVMESVPETEFGKTPRNPGHPERTPFVRGSGVSRIGQTSDSETFHPEVVVIEGQNIALYDCPGREDNRGEKIDICNGLSVVDIVQQSAEIKAFCLFCEYDHLRDARYESLIRNIQYLQRLLRVSPPFANQIQFAITKLPPNVNRETIANMLARGIAKVMTQTQEAAVQTFCQNLLELKVNQHILLSYPLDPANRGEILEMLVNSPSLSMEAIRGQLGYPISPQSLNVVNDLRNNLATNAENSLTAFQEAFVGYWNRVIPGADTVPSAKKMYERLLGIGNVFYSSIGYIAHSTLLRVDGDSRTAQRRLWQQEENWDKLGQLMPHPEDLDTRLRATIASFKSAIEELTAIAREHFFNLVYREIEASLMAMVETYTVQKTVIERARTLGDSSLVTADVLRGMMSSFSRETNIIFPHQELFDQVLANPLRMGRAQQVLQRNIENPFNIDRRDNQIMVTTRAGQIALSQVFLKMGLVGNPGRLNSIMITAYGLYFDENVSGASFIVYVNGMEIQVKRESAIDLRANFMGGTFFLQGMLQGNVSYSPQGALVLSPSEQPGRQQRIHQAWS